MSVVSLAEHLRRSAAAPPEPAPALEPAAADADREAEWTRREAGLRAALAAEHDARLAAEQARLLAEADERLADLEQSVCARIGRLLAPLVEERLRAEAVAELAQVLRRHLREAGTAGAVLSGPPALVEAVAAAADAPEELAVEVAPAAAEARLVVGATTFETALTAWSGRLHEALA